MSGSNEQTELEADIQPIAGKPSYVAYQITNRKDGEKPFWNRIGVGFLHRDGGGMNVLLNSLPVDGRITLRARPHPKESK